MPKFVIGYSKSPFIFHKLKLEKKAGKLEIPKEHFMQTGTQ